MNVYWNSFETLLGLGVEPRDLTFIQISLLGIIVFLVTLATVRIGHKRSLARKTPFDAVLLVILAAVLSRAINGSAAFFATLGGGAVLVLLHRLFAYLAFCSHGFGILVKGEPDLIVRDGQCDFQTMRRATTYLRMIWTRTCVLARTPTTFPRFDSHASNEAATSAS
jgi:uncharacterized membrane protein YcaP (DUF421 family)